MSKLLQSSAFRLAFGVVALFVVAAMLIGGYIMWRSNDLLTRQVLAMIEGEAASLRDVYSAGGIIALRQAIAERTARPGPTLYYLSTGARGRDVGNLSRLPPELATRPRGSTFVYDSVVGPQREQRLAVGIPFALGPDLKLLVGRDIEDQRHYARAVRVHVMAGLIALTFVGLLAGLWIARTILRRIDRITVASRAIMAGEWERRLPCNGSQDELDRLSANLNVMLDRIGELMAGMREVSDNIAHDLKTPLNRLRNRAEDALRGEQAEGHHRAALERVIDEADDLIRTFNALLAIARFESGAVGEQMQPVDLSTLVEDVAELFEPALDEAGLTLALEVERPSIAKVSRELVAQALVNLFENAIKYAPRDPGESPPQTAARPGDTVRAEAGPDIVLSLKRRGRVGSDRAWRSGTGDPSGRS
ncbi:MAG: HAMP domain-containing protein [Pseudomonadota bacterium]